MPGLLFRGPAAWSAAARLVAVLAGVALLYTPRCANGMLATDMSSSSAAASGPHMSGSAAEISAPMGAHPAGMAVAEGVTAPAPGGTGGDPGGVLATCLAFLVAALVALVGLSPRRWWRRVSAPGAPAPIARWDASRARPGGLARLCVLRI